MREDNSNMEELILEAAEELFLQKGFGLTSTTEIAAKAGCNQALVHYYFRTKAKLFEKVFEKKTKIFIDFFWKVDNEDIPFEEKIKKKIEGHFDLVAKNQRVPHMIMHEITTNPNSVEMLQNIVFNAPKEIFKALEVELSKEIKAGRIRPISVFDLVFTVVSLNMFFFISRPIIELFSPFGNSDFNSIIEKRKKEVTETILRSLRP